MALYYSLSNMVMFDFKLPKDNCLFDKSGSVVI